MFQQMECEWGKGNNKFTCTKRNFVSIFQRIVMKSSNRMKRNYEYYTFMYFILFMVRWEGGVAIQPQNEYFNTKNHLFGPKVRNKKD